MANDRISFEQLEDETVLVCRSAERLDEGSYTITLRNVKGSDTAIICVTTLDKPSAPEGPLDVSKITPESCNLKWNPPKVGFSDVFCVELCMGWTKEIHAVKAFYFVCMKLHRIMYKFCIYSRISCSRV